MEQQIYMTPKQPFFVTSSERYYKYTFHQYGIVHFYQCQTSTQPRYAIPDGCVDMVFCCNPLMPSAEICGTVLAPESVLLQSNTCYFGVRFLPGYNPLLGCTDIMRNLVNQRIPFSELIQDNCMLEKICSTTNFFQQIDAFLHAYLNLYHRIKPIEHSNLLVLHTSNLLIRSSGSIRIEDIAQETGYTTRYLDQCFRAETGLPPKQLAKILRFQAAISALNQPNGRTLTEIAADLGYFDQAHFVHDFKAYTGLTPRKYRLQLEGCQYHEKIKELHEQDLFQNDIQ